MTSSIARGKDPIEFFAVVIDSMMKCFMYGRSIRLAGSRLLAWEIGFANLPEGVDYYSMPNASPLRSVKRKFLVGSWVGHGIFRLIHELALQNLRHGSLPSDPHPIHTASNKQTRNHINSFPLYFLTNFCIKSRIAIRYKDRNPYAYHNHRRNDHHTR